MDLKNLCMGCMEDKGEEKTCPKCGYEETQQQSLLVLPPRTRLMNGTYLLGNVLGKPGGFGITYLAWDIKLETKVAIKEFLPKDLAGRSTDGVSIVPHHTDDTELFNYGMNQFLKEARALAKFDHPNIVRVRAFFEEHGTAYLVMNYYDGISLDEYQEAKGGKIPGKLAVDIMMPILDGLREVHKKGFLHRDIKPHNIYLTEGGIPILLDFGAARFAMGEKSRSLSVVLTPGYAPYEQYHKKGKQGPWTDIYAAGATMYRMITGITPPEATDRMMEDDIQPPNVLVPEVSQNIDRALMKALSLKNEDRPQRVGELQDMLVGKVAEIKEDEDRISDIEVNKFNENNYKDKLIKYDYKNEFEEPKRKKETIEALQQNKSSFFKKHRALLLGVFGWEAAFFFLSMALIILFAWASQD